MESKAKLEGIARDYKTGKVRLTFLCECQPENAENLMEHDLRLKATRWRVKRSLDANNYLWELLGQIQSALQNGMTKEELYMIMLQRYGSFMYLPASEDEVENLEQVFRIVIDRGESPLTTESGRRVDVHTYQCYKGSSLYDTKEMSVLLSGVIREAEDLGIDTATPDEKERMLQQWGERRAG